MKGYGSIPWEISEKVESGKFDKARKGFVLKKFPLNDRNFAL